ncbi:hypothetical protein GCM10022251_38700 [Phytohabitans flavus]|uniref:Uncharacterized protein n=1 Tax=Phytohabitans flavus TaxID=1076124 RepID=A0A6F8XVF0_9ACTN|nr:hypothetical protein Pflav_042150 [Phytohabitans flavus]
MAITRRWGLAALMCVLVVVAATGLRSIGTTQLTPRSHFHHHRSDLAALAAEYRRGSITGFTDLPRRMRWLSADGRAHAQCWTVDRARDRKQCVLYLRIWQNWRAESGVGFAYFSEPPVPEVYIATASGDLGVPAYELGDGWWWIE